MFRVVCIIARWLAPVTLALAVPAAAAQAQAQTASIAPTVSSAAAGVGRGNGGESVADSFGNYRLGAADKVRVIVFNEETLSGEFFVSDAGTLSLPLIGEVKAAGRTPTEVIKDIETKLADGYLREPRVSIDVLTYRPFYILGEVTKPGEYPFSNGLTVMNAVARAEGFTYRANKRRVFIKRAGRSDEERVDLSADLRVYPGDTIRIGERYF